MGTPVSSSLKWPKLKRKLSLVPFPLAVCVTVKCLEALLIMQRVHGGSGAFLHSLRSPPLFMWAKKSCGSCLLLSAAVSLSPGAEEDAVLGFHSLLLPGGELPQGCRFSPEDRHLQSFSLQRSSLALSFISAYSRETLQLSITLLWRGRVRYRIT